MTALLEARHVSKSFGGGFRRPPVTALHGVDFVIHSDRPTVTAVVGESGSGKTTLARILLGLTWPTAGEVRFQGQELRRLPRGRWKTFRRQVQAIFQDPFEVFNPFYRVDHVLTVPLQKFGLAKSHADARHQIEQALEAVGLRPQDTLGRYPHQLSGGQRQRVMVARALLLRPSVIIADEPVSMIDASLRATVLANIQQLKQDYGISILYITHDLTTAYQVSDRIIVLYRGSVVEEGDAEQVVKRPRHPYTRLLLDSIPLPDPDRPWGGERSETAGKGVVTVCDWDQPRDASG